MEILSERLVRDVSGDEAYWKGKYNAVVKEFNFRINVMRAIYRKFQEKGEYFLIEKYPWIYLYYSLDMINYNAKLGRMEDIRTELSRIAFKHTHHGPWPTHEDMVREDCYYWNHYKDKSRYISGSNPNKWKDIVECYYDSDNEIYIERLNRLKD